jgi:hypothetical protein
MRLAPVPSPRRTAPDQAATLDPAPRGRLIETFFGIITRRAIRRGTFTSVKDLTQAIRTFIDSWNERRQPFSWARSWHWVTTHAMAHSPC